MSDNEYKNCPYCAEDVKAGAIKCKHCHGMLEKKEHHSNGIASNQASLEEKLSKTGSALQSVGCILTLFVTIPILLFFIFVVIGC